MNQTKKLSAVPVSEASQVYRAIKKWLDTYSGSPAERMNYEYLPEDGGLTLVIDNQGARKTREYILGGYEAQCKIQIVYRVVCSNNDDRMKADEVLNSYGEWCERNIATLMIPAQDGKKAHPTKCTQDNESAIIARDNNIEIHSVSLTLMYEVFP